MDRYIFRVYHNTHMKRLVLLGSTGSIGTQTLDVVRSHPGEFQVIGLSSHKGGPLFDAQVEEFQPRYVVQTSVSENPQAALSALAATSEADLIINALSGSVGLAPTLAACKAGKRIALANKESLVMAGELIMKEAAKTGAQILPIDSEPSAIWQILQASPAAAGLNNSALPPAQPFLSGYQNIKKIILTASGGPFWGWRRVALKDVTSAQALKHPTWKMGEKVSIDSATLMNKAFEIIEARWLFDIPAEKIDVVVHRQSIVHSLVQYEDGNTLAVMSPPDMRTPISFALFYPTRAKRAFSSLDLSKLTLTFEHPDFTIFRGPRLAYEVIEAGGIMPAVFCVADEIAVQKFLQGEISFLEIYDCIHRALEQVKNTSLSLESIAEIYRLI